MYLKIKKFVRILIPTKILFKYELALRFFYYLFYLGKKYECNICRKNLRKFVVINNENICPRCGSMARTRRLWDLLKNKFLKPDISILDFSPSRSIYRQLKNANYNYLSSDLSGDFLSDVSYDITKIDCPDNSFDLIICYHILEHIEDDKKAMTELYRVLKKGGNCIIQTPFKEGDIYEHESIKTKTERLLHFGQSDHVRIYSVQGLRDRLINTGFNVDIIEFQNEDKHKNDFLNHEIVLVCRK